MRKGTLRTIKLRERGHEDMLITIAVFFFLLLALNFPIAVMLLAVAMISLYFYTDVSLVILIQTLFNGMDNYLLLSIPFFIIAGNIMARGAISRRIIEVMSLFVGRVRGGLAISSACACAFFAAISGSSIATVLAIGTIMIPALIKAGYPKRFSIGLITSAGSLGILIPPSVPMVLYCVVMEVSVAKLFMAGFLPGILITIFLSVYCYLSARRNKWMMVTRYNFSEAKKIMKEGVWAILLPVIVLGGIYSGFATPTEAAALSVVYGLVVELFVYKELKIGQFTKILKDSAVTSAALTFILACAMTFVWLLTREQLPGRVAEFIIANCSSKWLFLLALNVLLLILGCLMELVSIILILTPILSVTLQQFDIDLIHYGIIMIINAECGFLTPPFGLNLFVSMGLTGESLFEVGRSIVPFLLIFIGSLLIMTYIPEISLILPKLFYGP